MQYYKNVSLNQKGSIHLVPILIVAVIAGVVGSYLLVTSRANPASKKPGGTTSSSNVSLVPVTTDLHLGDFTTFQIKNLPKGVSTSDLRVIGSCYQDGKMVGNIMSQITISPNGKTLNGIESNGLVHMAEIGGGLSRWPFTNSTANCQTELKKNSNNGDETTLATIMVNPGAYRTSMSLVQTQPVSPNSKLTFKVSNLPSTATGSLFTQLFCDKANDGFDGLTNAVPVTIDSSGMTSAVTFPSLPDWAVGSPATCYVMLTQGDVKLYDGSVTGRTYSTVKFSVQR